MSNNINFNLTQQPKYEVFTSYTDRLLSNNFKLEDLNETEYSLLEKELSTDAGKIKGQQLVHEIAQAILKDTSSFFSNDIFRKRLIEIILLTETTKELAVFSKVTALCTTPEQQAIAADFFTKLLVKDFIFSGNIESIGCLIDAILSLKGKDYINKIEIYEKDFYLLLHFFAQYGKIELISLLLNKGADISFHDDNGYPPIHYAGQVEAMKFLIANGANVNTPGKNENTPLHILAPRGKIDSIKFLIANGANINAENTKGKTPLHKAVSRWSDIKVDAIEFLIANGANIHAQDKHGNTPLHKAAMSGAVDVIKLLLENGANIHAENTKGKTPLHKAAGWVTEVDAIKFLIAHGAKVNAQDKHGNTPLHEAAQEAKQVDVIKFLIANSANMNAQNKDGRTPLHEAAFKKRFDAMKVLITNDADVNARDNAGNTALHMAVIIANNDADVNARDYAAAPDLDTIFSDIAVEKKKKKKPSESEEIIKLLIFSFQAAPHILNNAGQTALDLATVGSKAHTLLTKAQDTR